MKTSQSGVDLIKSFEGFSYTAYVCPAGVLTIGYGHTGSNLKSDARVNKQQAEILLKKDLERFEAAVEKLVKIKLGQNQFDALVSFTFNLGSGALAESTLLRRLNSGEDPCAVAKEEMPKWNKVDGKPLSGLTRRRLAEVDLFCQEPPKLKTEELDITSKVSTWLKKEPLSSEQLPNDSKARIYQGRTIKNCTVIERKNQHTYLELGFGLGKWWIFDAHWDGLETKPRITPYAVDGNFKYLRNFPYFWQQDNGPEGWRQCQTSSIAMCLKYLDVPGIENDVDYLKIVNKYGDTTHRVSHYEALEELKTYAKFITSADEHTVKDEIDKGLPVVAGILHHGDVFRPTGGGHFVVITGYSDTHWLVQDPYGKLDLVNGGWEKSGADAGKNVHYSFKNLNPRFCPEGGASGWCWINFKRI